MPFFLLGSQGLPYYPTHNPLMSYRTYQKPTQVTQKVNRFKAPLLVLGGVFLAIASVQTVIVLNNTIRLQSEQLDCLSKGYNLEFQGLVCRR